MVIIELENKDNASSSVTYTFDCNKTLEFKKDTGCDWLTIETVKGTGGAKDVIKITTPKANEGERRTCYVTPMVGEYLCSPNKFMVAQGGGSPTPPGPKPDPKSDCCVTPLDNIGQVCNTSKTAAQYFIDAGFACEGTHWWSGPLDGEGDAGFPATGWTDAGDSIRCSFDKLVLTPMDTWITATTSNNPHTQDGKEYSGYANYTIAANTDSKPRVGRVKVTLTGEENSRFEWDEHPAGTPFCMGKSEGGACEGDKEMYVYIYQQGSSSPATCTITGGEAVPAYAFPGSSERIKIGSYSNCSGTLSAEHKSGADFLNDFEIANGDIKAKVSSTNTDCTHQRVGTYSIKNGTTEIGTLEVTQKSFDESTKINGVSLKNHSITIEFDKDGNMKGTYLYEPSFMGIEFSNKPEWLTSIEGSSGVITGTASPNQSADEKGYPIMITIGGCTNQENVKQDGTTQSDFSINGHTSDFSEDVYGAFYTTTYTINNSKEASFEITGSGGGDDAYCKIDGELSGDIDTEGA